MQREHLANMLNCTYEDICTITTFVQLYIYFPNTCSINRNHFRVMIHLSKCAIVLCIY